MSESDPRLDNLFCALGKGLFYSQTLESWTGALLDELAIRKIVSSPLNLDDPRQAARRLKNGVEKVLARKDSKATLGQLVNRLVESGEPEVATFEGAISELLEKRNFLIHGFLAHHQAGLVTPSGLSVALDEAEHLARSLRAGSSAVKALVLELARSRGMGRELERLREGVVRGEIPLPLARRRFSVT